MKKGIMIHSGNETDVLNLYFTGDTVTVRTFRFIGKPGDLDGGPGMRGADRGPRIGLVPMPQSGEQVSAENMKSPEELYEEALKEKFDLAKLGAMPQKVLLEGTKDLTGKFVKIDGQLHQVVKQTTFGLDKQIWKPYSEICMTLMKNVGLYPERHLVAFFDRNTQTINGREDFSQFHKKFRLSDSYVAFRWFVLPGTDMMTAPVIANPSQKLITNLDMGSDIVTGSGGIVTPAQKQRADTAVTLFREYWIPRVVISGPDSIRADGIAEFTVQCFHKGDQPCTDSHEYYLETVSGYAPHKRIQVVRGKGAFRIMALGLRKGETLRFKVNDKYWTGKAEKTLTVI